MALRPLQPGIGVPNKYLPQKDHLVGNPADGMHTNHMTTHLHGTALGRRLGRIPYASKANVAMRPQGNPEKFSHFPPIPPSICLTQVKPFFCRRSRKSAHPRKAAATLVPCAAQAGVSHAP